MHERTQHNTPLKLSEPRPNTQHPTHNATSVDGKHCEQKSGFGAGSQLELERRLGHKDNNKDLSRLACE